MGQRQRRLSNAAARARGNEPQPGIRAGVKRWMRYLKRVGQHVTKIKNPSRHLHTGAVIRAAIAEAA
jgi:hypothetical protein